LFHISQQDAQDLAVIAKPARNLTPAVFIRQKIPLAPARHTGIHPGAERALFFMAKTPL
jgi:hypothetical protein